MSYGQPTQLANLKPAWPKGHKPNTTRRSRDVDRCLKLARKHCPEAMLLLIECMRDVAATWPERVKAAQGVLAAGLPKDPDAFARFFGDDSAALLRIEFVDTATVTIERSMSKTITNGRDDDDTLQLSFGDEDS